MKSHIPGCGIDKALQELKELKQLLLSFQKSTSYSAKPVRKRRVQSGWAKRGIR